MVLKIKNYILSFCLTFYMFGCTNSQDMHWKEIDTKGTEKSNYIPGVGTNYQFYKFNFIDDKTGFLSGLYDNQIDNDIDNMTWASVHLNESAVILRTTDSGYNWKETILGKGEIVDFNNVDNTLIVLRQSYHGKEADEVVSHIHISKDKGVTWEEVGYNTEDQLDAIHFWTAEKGIAICGLKGSRYTKLKILYTDNTGKNWKEIELPKAHDNMDFTINKEGVLYYLTTEGTNYLQINLNNLDIKEHSISQIKENPFSVVIDNNENLYFIVENDEKRNIMYRKLKDNNSFEKINFPVKDVMINDVHIYDNVISIIIDENNGEYYRSEDYGKTWSNEHLQTPIIRNISFFKKDNIWMRTIPGKMMIRD